MTIEEEFKESIDNWMREGLEELRYAYVLNKDSIVFDIGFYKGDFTKKIFKKYGCNIYAFEPVEKYFSIGINNIPKSKKIRVFNYGIGYKDDMALISVQDDSSSLFKFENIIGVQIKSFSNILYELKESVDFIDLVKINIEGAEYDLLDYMLNFEIVNICKNIQIQFHTFVENAKGRRDIIRERLIVTHKETYNFPYVWENWTLK